MLKRVNALMESKEFREMFESNEELIQESAQHALNFAGVLKDFVINHPEEFIGEDLDVTYKNIRLFAEVATSQFLSEMSAMYSEFVKTPSDIINEYL